MKKPQNWDTTEAFTGEFKSITPGGHVCRIRQAASNTTPTGKEVLIIAFDIAEGEFKGFYAEQFTKRKTSNPDAKWQGIYRQFTEGNSTPFFKGIITAIENSNPGYTWNWDEKTLKDKLFGGVFGQEEYLNDKGERKLSTKCMQIRSVVQIKKGVKAPEIKRLKNDASQGLPAADVFPEENMPF
jgi:hypothetical protein